ncbi:hypothetical protein [Serratia quinivorans]|uniref:hypothetical protein n=1 Tax=Serratia quinivorans TaxID=137545 RepID=UPI0021BB391F|nr:hypothetical protein [Serratia quinivorans]
MSAFAAANHRLDDEAEVLLAAFPWLIADRLTRQDSETLIHLALDTRYLTSASYNPWQAIAQTLSAPSIRKRYEN